MQFHALLYYINNNFKLMHPHNVMHHIHAVNNPVINISQTQLMQQAQSLGTPVTTVLNSQSFAQIAPGGVIIPGSSGNGQSTMMLYSVTSLCLAVLVSTFVILDMNYR